MRHNGSMDNGNAPATKRDLAEVKTELKQDIAEVKHDMAGMENRLSERIRDSQTEILKAFLPYQESQNLRLRTLEAKLSNTDTGITERMAILERRLAEIEKRLLLNPPAA
jgi:hypothetical protein